MLWLKFETKFIWAKWRVKVNETLVLEVHWPPLVILSWWHEHKTEKWTSIDCCAKFLLGVSNHSLYNFSDFLEKKFCHKSRACHIFCLQTISTHCLFHPQPNVFTWKTPRLIWCGVTQDLVGHIFWLSIGHSALNVATAVERVAMTGPVFPCSKGRSFLLEDSRHVTVVLSLFRLWGQFQVELPSRWPLKHSTGVRFHPCFCQLVCHCLHFFCTFPSFSYFKSRQTMLKGSSRGIQAPQGAQLRLLYQTSPRS